MIEGDKCPVKGCGGKLVFALFNCSAEVCLMCDPCGKKWGVRSKRNISTGITTAITPIETHRKGETYPIEYRGGGKNKIPASISTKGERAAIKHQGGPLKPWDRPESKYGVLV